MKKIVGCLTSVLDKQTMGDDDDENTLYFCMNIERPVRIRFVSANQMDLV